MLAQWNWIAGKIVDLDHQRDYNSQYRLQCLKNIEVLKAQLETARVEDSASELYDVIGSMFL